MGEHICGLDIWYDHGRRLIYKGVEMLQEDFRALERHICVVWYHEEDSRQGPIGCTLPQLEDAGSDDIHD